MVRWREEGEHSDDELAARFRALDADGSGAIDMYAARLLCPSLHDSPSPRNGSFHLPWQGRVLRAVRAARGARA